MQLCTPVNERLQLAPVRLVACCGLCVSSGAPLHPRPPNSILWLGNLHQHDLGFVLPGESEYRIIFAAPEPWWPWWKACLHRLGSTTVHLISQPTGLVPQLDTSQRAIDDD